MDSLSTSERMMVDSTADMPAEGFLRAIVSEIDRLQPVQFDNTTAMFDSLLQNHSRCDSVYLDEMLAKFGPELPALNVGSELDDKPLSGSDIRSSANNLSGVASSEGNFVEENFVEVCPARNDLMVQENTTLSSVELVAMKTQLQQQHDMILELQKSNSDLKDQVTQQHEMILELRKNGSQQQQQLNTLTEAHRMNEALLDERLLATQALQDLTAEISDRTQIEIAEMNIFTTNERTFDSGQMEQLQETEGLQLCAEEYDDGSVVMTESNDISFDVEQHNKSDSVVQSASTLSSRMKHQTKKGIGKRIVLDSTEASHKNRQNSRKKELKTNFCGECSNRFNGKSDLTKHLRIHNDEKPYKCRECDAAFRESGNLKVHQRIHSNKKPYECNECNAAFSHLSNLKVHQRIHSNEKPYECKECDAAFSQSGSLKAHQRIHSDEKPFMCDICQKSFRHKSTLTTHIDIHSGKKSNKCNVCQKEFRYRSNLKKHLEVHSKEKKAQP